MIIRCTAKLLKEMGLGKANLANNASEELTLGEWYAHIFFLARRKCILFTHAKTYYAFVAYDVKREDIRQLDKLFRANLGRRLYEDGFSAEAIKKALAITDRVIYGHTADRHVLGVMNQMIYEFSFCLYPNGIVTPEALKKSADFLPRSLHTKGRSYIVPLEEMWPLLEEKKCLAKNI